MEPSSVSSTSTPSPSTSSSSSRVLRTSTLPLPTGITVRSVTKGASLTTLSHRLIEFTSGFQAVVISHPEVQKSAASMFVGVGASSDPNAEDGLLRPWDVEDYEDPAALPKSKDLSGLAHFCEHMLFLGTEKYPTENEFNRFIQTHSGHHNATTAFEGTNYFFDVSTEHLQGALDRFGQFFLGPLFTEGATDREINAVHQEHSRNVLQDANRILASLKDCSRTGHPFHRFNTGNSETLKTIPASQGVDVRQELFAFHRRHYYPENMTMAVVGRESLDTLQSWVVDLFSEMQDRRTEEDKIVTKQHKLEEKKNQELSPFETWSPPFNKLKLPCRITYSPVKHLRSIRFIWQLPSFHQSYKEKPSRYLSHLLGHEAPGSILYALKKRGLANELSAGPLYEAKEFCLWNLNIDLTEEGLKRKDEVKAIVFEYIECIKKAGVPEWVFEENKRMMDISFRFKEEEQPRDYVQSLSKSLQYYPAEDVLAGPHTMERFNQGLTSQFLSHLTPDNLVELVITQNIAGSTERTVKYFGAEYKFELIKGEKLHVLTGESPVHLPTPNPYIPSRFDIKPLILSDATLLDSESKTETTSSSPSTTSPSSPTNWPMIVKKTELYKLWHKQDTTYLKPKADWFFLLKTPLIYHSPYWEVISHFFIDLCEDELQSSLYNASISGLHFFVKATLDGISVHVRGFDEKLPLLLQNVIQNLLSASFDPNRFEALKEKRKRLYLSWPQTQPWTLMKEELSAVLYDRRWRVDEKLAALLPITLSEVQSIVPSLLTTFEVESFCQGNITSSEAISTLDSIMSLLPSPKTIYPLAPHHQRRIISLSPSLNHLRALSASNPKEANSGCIAYYQLGPYSIRQAALNDLWAELVSEPAFSTLRTKEQLGYIVWRHTAKTESILGYKFTIQSSVASPAHLDERIEHFLTTFRNSIETDMKEDGEFDVVRKSVITKLEQKPVNLVEEAGWNWYYIANCDGHFDILEKVIAVLKELRKADILTFIDTYLLPNSNRKKLSIHFHGNQHQTSSSPSSSSSVPIENVAQWKQYQSLYPSKVIFE